MAERLPEPYHSVPLTTHPVVVKDESAERRIYPDRYTPESEELARAEVRVTALGTGYPARRGQGCAGWLVECGNGQSFIFDAGPGTNMAFNTLRLPYWKATRFFITHFHLDHIADLPVYYDFGQTNGRLEPMHIHGPDGSGEGESTEAVVDAIKRLATWHDRAKAGLDPRVYEITPHRFAADEATLIYEEDGVAIRAFPVPHSIFGAVGYRLDYAGLSLVYAGDCEPSTFTVENAKGVDLLIHEIFNPPEMYMEKMGWPELIARTVAWTMHTAPQAAAKVFEATKPGMAMGYHAMIAPGTPQPILDGLRTGYGGPFTLAQDYTVVNITAEQIVTRMAEVHPWEFIVTDPAYVQRMGGSNVDLAAVGGLPDWLSESVISVPEIDEFKRDLARQSGRG